MSEAHPKNVERMKNARVLKPGVTVVVVTRNTDDGILINKLRLWQQPKDIGPFLSSKQLNWRKPNKWKGPNIPEGSIAIVISLLQQNLFEDRSRTWALLLTTNNEIGWCYALDGLKILSPNDTVG